MQNVWGKIINFEHELQTLSVVGLKEELDIERYVRVLGTGDGLGNDGRTQKTSMQSKFRISSARCCNIHMGKRFRY